MCELRPAKNLRATMTDAEITIGYDMEGQSYRTCYDALSARRVGWALIWYGFGLRKVCRKIIGFGWDLT